MHMKSVGLVNLTSKPTRLCRKKRTTAGFVLSRILGLSSPSSSQGFSGGRRLSTIFYSVDTALHRPIRRLLRPDPEARVAVRTGIPRHHRGADAWITAPEGKRLDT